MITRASNLAEQLPEDSENDIDAASIRVEPISFPKAPRRLREPLAQYLIEWMLTGLACTLMLGCLIFGFGSKTKLADVYLLPATYSGPAIESILMLQQGHPLIRGGGHQLSVILSIAFCLLFWTIVFGAMFRFADHSISKIRRQSHV